MRLQKIYRVLEFTQRSVAQYGSASALGAGGRRFKSCHSDFVVVQFSILNLYDFVLWDWYGTLFSSRCPRHNAQVREIVASISKNQGIVSNGIYEDIVNCKAYDDLKDYIHSNFILTPSLGYKYKPDTEMFYCLVKKLGHIQNISTIFIGDEYSDEVMAEKANCAFIYVQNLLQI